MVLADFFVALGAWLLVVFTLAANVLYHDYWSIDDAERRCTQRSSFYNNVAVMGGLLPVMAWAAISISVCPACIWPLAGESLLRTCPHLSPDRWLGSDRAQG